MWIKQSKLDLFGLTLHSEDVDETIKELIKRLKADDCFENSLKNRWIKRLEKITEKEDKWDKEKDVDRVLKSIYDYGDARRVWVS